MNAPVASPEIPTAEVEQWFHTMATHYVESQALFHLNRCGVLVQLAENEPSSASSLAAAAGTNPEMTELLLLFLSRVGGMLERDADGCYAFGSFGRAFLKRYSRKDANGLQINTFNTRIGAFGPVWSNLDKLLTGTFEYGRDFRRNGEEAQLALYRSSIHFLPAVERAIAQIRPKCVVELGVGSGIADRVKEAHGSMRVLGVDKSTRPFTATKARSPDLEIDFIQSHVEDTASWANEIPVPNEALLVSIHFHEFLAGMSEREFTDMVGGMRETLAGSHLLVFEQPDLPCEVRESTPQVEWLHAQSNLLIHHLIGNGRILRKEAWVERFTSLGLRLVDQRPTGFIGYEAFLFEIS